MTTRFAEVWPRTPMREMMLLGLGLPTGPLALVQLYLSTGRCAPPDHALGCMFGFCNAGGEFVPRKAATHVGWTLATETNAGADAECLEHITQVHVRAEVEATHTCCGCNGGRRSCGREPCPSASLCPCLPRMVRRAVDAGSDLLLMSGVPSPEDPRAETTRAYFLMAAVVLNKRADEAARQALAAWRTAVAAIGCPYCAAVRRAADECRGFPKPGPCPLVS